MANSGIRLPGERGLSAYRPIRQRRSEVAFNGRTTISSGTFYRMLQRRHAGRLSYDPVCHPTLAAYGFSRAVCAPRQRPGRSRST